MRCRQLDYIDGKDNRFMSSEALSSNWKRGIQISNGSTGDRVVTETVTANVKSTGRKRLNVIAVEPRKTADRPVYCPVSVVPTPQGEAVGTHAGELFPEEPKVVPAEITLFIRQEKLTGQNGHWPHPRKHDITDLT